MFSSGKTGASAYANVGLETGVAAASPHQLIIMLFDGALNAITIAQSALNNKDILLKNKSITHAVNIVSEGLRASLNMNQGGVIAQNLNALYIYIEKQLMLANIHNDVTLLQEGYRLLKELRDAWNEIKPPVAAVSN